MSKNIILCFDGTSNEPRDASQEVSSFGGIEDDNITNILKLHLIFGGDLVGGARFDNQISFYHPGVGTYGSKVQRIFNKAFAPDFLDVGDIIKAGIKDVQTHYRDGDQLFVFGFSRGAAIARRFASILPERYGANSPRIRFLGVFDTVASIGKPNLDDDEQPVSDVVFENGTISSSIDEALHLISLDERRKAFRPTLMNRDPRVTEIWFPGAHSDIGGGFRQDGLSDHTLQFLLNELAKRGLGLDIVPPSQIAYEQLVSKEADYQIDLDDVQIDPNEFGTLHSKRRTRLTSRITLGDRDLRVNVNDRRSEHLPMVHASVANRIYGDREYRPRALRHQRHTIVWEDGTEEMFSGLSDHLERGQRHLRQLKTGESAEVEVQANLKYNRSAIFLEQGARYTFDVPADQRWYDGKIECGPKGWKLGDDDVRLGMREGIIWVSQFNRRLPIADWLEVLASIGDTDDDLIRVLHHSDTSHPYLATRSGELCTFANDLNSKYGNNFGTIRVRITRVA